MKKKKYEAMVLDYLNTQDNRVREDLIKKLDQLGTNLDDLKALKAIYDNLEKIEVPEPDSRLTENFYEILESYNIETKRESNGIIHQINRIYKMKRDYRGYKFAYAFILLLIGWSIGFIFLPNQKYRKQVISMSNEIQHMKVMITLTLLDQSSPYDRLRGIHNANHLEEINEQVIEALLQTLNNDPNIDVRLEAIQTLMKFTDHPTVRKGLVQSISQQESPIVQLYLANIMVTLQEKDSISHLKRLLKENKLDHDVREKIEKSIIAII